MSNKNFKKNLKTTSENLRIINKILKDNKLIDELNKLIIRDAEELVNNIAMTLSRIDKIMSDDNIKIDSFLLSKIEFIRIESEKLVNKMNKIIRKQKKSQKDINETYSIILELNNHKLSLLEFYYRIMLDNKK